jgi:hypothetical protein
MPLFNIEAAVGHPPANIRLVTPGSKMDSVAIDAIRRRGPGGVRTPEVNLKSGLTSQFTGTHITWRRAQIIDDIIEILMNIAVKGSSGHGPVSPEKTPQRNIDGDTGNQNDRHHFSEDRVEYFLEPMEFHDLAESHIALHRAISHKW